LQQICFPTEACEHRAYLPGSLAALHRRGSMMTQDGVPEFELCR